jgi:L-ribulose-5-phosphate 3-epimerase UlaE
MHEHIKYGIVQGRLIQSPAGQLQWFPQEYWESEFFLASALGYDFIELIAERENNPNNPIWFEEGVGKIKSLCQRNNLFLHTLCNDYIINHPLAKDGSVVEQVLAVTFRCKLLGIRNLILPLFEQSEITDSNFSDYKNILREIACAAEKNNTLVSLETMLNGQKLLELLAYLDHPNIKCVFDTGNRIAWGHDAHSDILLLGEKICHVHIKDKNDNNDNVILGTGKVNFYEIFKAFSAINYFGPYTFETFRGKDPIRTAKYNRLFVEYFIEEASEHGIK